MNASQKLVVWVEGLLFVILALLIESIFPETITSYNITVAISLNLLVFIHIEDDQQQFYRWCSAWCSSGWLQVENVQTEWMVQWPVQPSSYGCLSGKFVRNLQRTLFNRCMSMYT